MPKKATQTPYLAIDISVLMANLERMQVHVDKAFISLRPHIKTHKIIELAKRQLALGAIGVTVATIGEAEVFAKKGIRDIFIAYPLYLTPDKARRLRKIARRCRLSIGVDSIAGVGELAKHLPGTEVLVEIDSGHHRSGCEPEDTGSIAMAAVESGLKFKGIFTFPGHSYFPGARKSAVTDETNALRAAIRSCREKALEPQVISSGSTPTAMLTGKSVVNELRPGVYVFNDAQQWELGSCRAKDIALTAHATVVSSRGRRLIVDAGSKILGADRASWATGYGRLLDFPKARIVALSEHHATIEFPATGNLPKLGSVVRVVPNHVCNSVNLVDEVVLLENGEATGSWKVAARGKNS